MLYVGLDVRVKHPFACSTRPASFFTSHESANYRLDDVDPRIAKRSIRSVLRGELRVRLFPRFIASFGCARGGRSPGLVAAHLSFKEQNDRNDAERLAKLIYIPWRARDSACTLACANLAG